jgi:hypothetical protein
MGIFDSIFGAFDSSDGEESAANAAAARTKGFQTGKTDAFGALDSGFGTASGFYDSARAPFSDLLGRGNRGYDTYLDATGVNGQGGIDRAGSLFKSLPGYRGGLDTGLDLLERRAAARGDLGGGNTSADTIKYASDYDAQKYGNFLQSLVPNIGVAGQATSGVADLFRGQGNLASDVGTKKAGYGYQAAVGEGGAEAQGIEDAQKAKDQASKNFWSAIMGGANLATKAFTGGF